MKIWNYIGEFLLFRWLFGKLTKSTTEHDTQTECSKTSMDGDCNLINGSHKENNAPIDDAVTAIGDNLIDDSDNPEELDDLDIFMRDNKGNNPSCLHDAVYGSNHHSSGRSSGRSNNNDWYSRSYSQSFNDFHEEQDDYDMFDDF